MKLMSKTRLIPILIEQGFITTSKGVHYEAYGSKVMAYIRVQDMATRYRLENFLKTIGVPFNRKYYPGAPIVEARVSYFKAWHWDE